jgi:hypothetical protein
VTDKPNKPDPRERFAELLGTNSKNFLGTGLTMNEFMQLHRAEQLTASWALQSPEEKKRRLHAVLRLSQELGRIKETTLFSTRLAEMAIEAVIEGDWKMVEGLAGHFTFSTEGEETMQIYAPVFAAFRELLLQVLRMDKELPA